MRLDARLLLPTVAMTVRSPLRSVGVGGGAVRMNLFGDLFDDKLKPITPYERPLLSGLVKSDASMYVLQEKMFSFSGEDFEVKDLSGGRVIQIDGANINLGGFVLDKLAFRDAGGQKFCSVERRALAASTCSDIYSADGKTLLAKVERDWIPASPKYKFYYEGDMNPFADFEAEGSFSDRAYTFRAGGDCIARVKRAPELVKDLDSYTVEVAGGVDAAAILAVAVIIDEDHDEEDAKKAKEKKDKGEEGGFWPFS